MVRAPHSVRVILLRHGPAALRDPRRWPDDARRPLTPKGAEQTRHAVRGLVRYLSPMPRLATSDAVRCKLSAEMLRAALEPAPKLEIWEELGPGSLAPPILDRITAGAPRNRDLVLVGHEPTFTELLGLALIGEGTPFVQLGKGAAACLEFPAQVRAGGARLRWLLSRKQLARCE